MLRPGGADLVDALVFLAVLMPSVILHEVSHGAVALAFGDDTARRAGRLTLNPLPHIDPFGTVLLPAILVYTTGAAFGYARPVPVNPGRMRRPRDHGLLTSLAGPAVNIVLALLAAGAVKLLAGGAHNVALLRVVVSLGVANVILAAFNLIPIPPLDGSAVVERLLPRRWLPAWANLRRYSMAVLLVIVLLLPGPLNTVFGWAIGLWGALV